MWLSLQTQNRIAATCPVNFQKQMQQALILDAERGSDPALVPPSSVLLVNEASLCKMRT